MIWIFMCVNDLLNPFSISDEYLAVSWYSSTSNVPTGYGALESVRLKVPVVAFFPDHSVSL